VAEVDAAEFPIERVAVASVAVRTSEAVVVAAAVHDDTDVVVVVVAAARADTDIADDVDNTAEDWARGTTT